MPARVVISPNRWFLLSSHIICYGKFNLVLLFSFSDRAHQLTYDWLLCSSLYFISFLRASTITKSCTIRSAMPVYASIFLNNFLIPDNIYSAFPRVLLTPPLSYELHSEDRLEVDTVPFVCFIAGVNRMMFGFLGKMKREIMVVEAFVLFFPVAHELNCGS